MSIINKGRFNTIYLEPLICVEEMTRVIEVYIKFDQPGNEGILPKSSSYTYMLAKWEHVIM